MNSKKWRGIKTTSKKINEKKAKTIINRLGQKSISLPRIDDKKRWAGYPGLAGTARKISEMVPSGLNYYIEPFAGSVKVFQMVDPTKFKYAMLNDKSWFVHEWLVKEFTADNVRLFCEDFIPFMNRYRSYRDTFYLIDPPWNKSFYMQNFSCFDRNSVKEYDEQVLDICRKIEGKFIITTRKENTIMKNSEFKHKFIRSEYVVSGKYPEVMITTNLEGKL